MAEKKVFYAQAKLIIETVITTVEAIGNLKEENSTLEAALRRKVS